MNLGIAGRKALLTGASRGLGKACALALAREGADITIVARSRETLERTADEIRAAGAVLDDEVRPHGFVELLHHDARHHVDRAARRIGHDHADGAAGIGLGGGRCGQEVEQNHGRRDATKTFHGGPFATI